MQKLYPQVLRAEQNIQELRGELQEAESQGRSQRGALTEADRQIRDLYAKLGLAERRQRDLNHEHDFVTQETEDCRERWRRAEQECQELTEILNRSEIDVSKGLRMLSTGSCRQEQEREQIDLAAQDVIERRDQLLVARSLTEELNAQLERKLREGRGLFGELTCAHQLDVLQRERLEEAQQEQERQHSRLKDADQTCRELRREVAMLEQDSQQTGSKLTTAEMGDRENEKLREELCERIEEMNSLEARCVAANQGSRDSLEATVMSGKFSEELQNEIVAAEEEVQLKRASMDHVEDWWRTTEVKLSHTKREHNTLNNSLHRAEKDTEATEHNVEQQMSDLYDRDGSLRERVVELEDEMLQAQSREEESKSENEEIQEAIETMHRESSVLTLRKTEYEQAVEEMRNKPACSVS
mmetsp:Transcript_140141/g.355407  ORF Transcript_140141/g.355407 Transcript_140141/m.355407 type:complete len:413 (+) Transcript_140141:166-1404(+)